ncbi:tripartite tricarboxylate transporter permease [Roseibacterium sp. SDUM158016]|uniref:tripartite tricarboxylate transporter permease n=1 Tax=Roseicyclus sediminis TaxID=2980997 RepID=UPI0021D37AAB|nr:tripartite tricarboxylate transporter permease [Roseibacterium sp. SDUM158016]MCU4652036.1 tripartite tricarboxylate transporter permease [Roseibacterium sp. SDUM158016]
MEILANVALGLETALEPTNLLYCFLGVALGTIVGVIPGVGPLAAIAMLIPLTFYLDPTPALIMLAGIWYGTTYGGSTASILLNVPGTTSAAVTALDGYPMAQQGRASVALFMTAVASFAGGSIGIIVMMGFAPLIAQYALNFGPTEYFALMLLGLVAAASLSDGPPAKGLAVVTLGVAFGCIGTDIYSGAQRFTFDSLNLMDGLNLIALAIGLFGIAEIISTAGRREPTMVTKDSVRLRAMIPTKDDRRRSWMPVLRGAGFGSFFGTLPGTGPSIASFVAYAFEKRISKTPERFGKGAIEGIMAPEAANNAADQTAFIPTLALGVPGSATMALMLGVLIIHGIQPGPTLMAREPELFWGLVMSFWIGNLLLLVLNIPLVGLWARLLLVPYYILYPAVLVFICIGTLSVQQNIFHVWTVAFFGVVGYLMRVLGFSAAPLLLGFVLGPLMEEHFRRAMLISGGDFGFFFDRPISAVVMCLTGILLAHSLYRTVRAKMKSKAGSAA